MGWVDVPKSGRKPPSPREDASEVPVRMVVVPKTGQKSPLPRGDVSEVPVGRVAVAEGEPKIGHRSDSAGFRETLPFLWHALGVRNLALWVRVVSGWHLELRLLSSCGEFCFTYKNV